MSIEGLSAPVAPPQRRPVWKSPFVIAFIIGVVSLTALPFMQKHFLSAPPPLRTLAPWSLATLGGGAVGSATLEGRVWLGMMVPGPCDASCRTRVEAFGRALPHLADLGERVELVSFVMPDGVSTLSELPRSPHWHVATGGREALAPVLFDLRAGWDTFAHTDAGSTLEDFSALPAVLLVDQQGGLRGFWRDDTAGRGNAINAARLLARAGPTP